MGKLSKRNFPNWNKLGKLSSWFYFCPFLSLILLSKLLILSLEIVYYRLYKTKLGNDAHHTQNSFLTSAVKMRKKISVKSQRASTSFY